ncbi:MAG: hypothetical protein J6W13_03230 [Salinivirgaceae bacterium]|nr:hypothetical protein [Salinivirgaceae bacterium]
MAEFTYELPSEASFYEGVKAIVKAMVPSEFKNDLTELLSNGVCELSDTGKFSEKRWNANGVVVRINVSMDVFTKMSDKIVGLQKSLIPICDRVIPANAGYDVVEVSISPLFEPIENDTLKKIIEVVTRGNYLNIGDDLVEKGKKMANAYVTLYALENYIRHYIDAKLTEKYGNNYMGSVSLTRKMKERIEERKKEEQSNKWLPLRGNNDLYYLDFVELADLITNNWDYFKDDIKDQNWIKVKMTEMYSIRCLIAHNSYISDDNIELLNATTKQILKQLYS